MNWRTVLVGFTGGLLLCVTLEYPLKQYLPGSVAADGPSASIGIAVLLVAVSAVLLTACGVLAARLGKAEHPRQAAMIGAVAGLIAAGMAEIWVGGAAAGILGNRAALAYGSAASPAEDAPYLQLLLDGTVATMQWTFASVWITLVVGAGLGALGGALLGRGTATGVFNPLVGPPVVFLGILCSAAAAIFTMLTFDILDPSLAQAIAAVQAVQTQPDAFLSAFPVATSFALLLSWQLLGVWIVRRIRQDTVLHRMVRTVSTWVFGLLPFAILLLSTLMLGSLHFNAWMIVGFVLSIAIGLGTLLQGFTPRAFSETPEPAVPPGAFYYLWVAVLGSGIALFCLRAGVFAYALSMLKLDVPLIAAALERGAESLPGAPGQTAQTLSALVDSHYALHRTSLLYDVPLAMFLGVLAAASVWFLRRQSIAQQAPTGRTWLIQGLVCFFAAAVLLFLIVAGAYILPVYFLSASGGL